MSVEIGSVREGIASKAEQFINLAGALIEQLKLVGMQAGLANYNLTFGGLKGLLSGGEGLDATPVPGTGEALQQQIFAEWDKEKYMLLVPLALTLSAAGIYFFKNKSEERKEQI